MRWEDAVEGYWLARRRDMSQNTVNDYSVTFRRFGDWVGLDRNLSTVTPADVDGFLGYLADDLGLARKTVSNAWTALSSMWSYLEEQHAAEHILRKVRRPRYRKKPPDPFTPDEVRRLLDATASFRAYAPKWEGYVNGSRPQALRDAAIIVLLVATGLRASELRNLDVGDYDRKRGKITVRNGKGNKTRILFCGDAANRRIWHYLNARARPLQPGAPLFVSTATGQGMTKSALYLMIRRCGDRAGVEKAHPHRFRHTFAIEFLRNGGSIAALREMLGHEKMETVLLYARLAEVDIELAQRNHNVADGWNL